MIERFKSHDSGNMRKIRFWICPRRKVTMNVNSERSESCIQELLTPDMRLCEASFTHTAHGLLVTATDEADRGFISEQKRLGIACVMPMEPKDFDQLLAIVGEYGKYQKKLVYLFIYPMGVVLPFFIMVFFFQVAVPSHWCHVEGRERLGFSVEEWKNLTIPK